MEVKNWSYEDYPEYHTDLKDAELLDTTGDEVFVSYYPDVEYAVIDGNRLTLQIMVPETRNHPGKIYPVILYVQGSAWGRQDVHRGVPELSKLAARGYVTAIVQYRGSDIAPFPATLVDTRNAVRFMKLHAGEYHGDPNQIILAGSSSGGHAAVYAPIYREEKAYIAIQAERRSPEGYENVPGLSGASGSTSGDSDLYPGISPDVRGIIDFYGSVSIMRDDSNPSTINHCLPDSPEGREMGGVNLREHPELRELLSVECQITKDTDIPPVLIVHGTKDRTVNPECSAILYRKLKECGKDAEIIFLPGADHGGGEFWSEPVLKRVDRFVKRCLCCDSIF